MLNNKRQNQIITVLIIVFLILLYVATWGIHSIISRNKVKDSITTEIQNKDEEVKGEETEKKPNNDGNNGQSQDNSNKTDNEIQNGEENQDENQEKNEEQKPEDTPNDKPGEIVDYKDRIKIMEDGKTEWKEIKELRIFNNYYFNYKPVIAPGVNGLYNFTIENISNSSCLYNVHFEEENKYNINMVYKLKLNGKYILGNENTWLELKELKLSDELLNGNTRNVYTLEWKWKDSDNDTQVGKNVEASYKINVIVNAVEKEGM